MHRILRRINTYVYCYYKLGMADEMKFHSWDPKYMKQIMELTHCKKLTQSIRVTSVSKKRGNNVVSNDVSLV